MAGETLDVTAVRARWAAWSTGNPYSAEGGARCKASAADVPALLDALEAVQGAVELVATSLQRIGQTAHEAIRKANVHGPLAGISWLAECLLETDSLPDDLRVEGSWTFIDADAIPRSALQQVGWVSAGGIRREPLMPIGFHRHGHAQSATGHVECRPVYVLTESPDA